MATDLQDRADISDLLTRYLFAVDDRDWHALLEVFSEDAVFDASGHGIAPMVGRDVIMATFSSRPAEPRSHHTLNSLVVLDGDSATVRSKCIVAYTDRWLIGEYNDRAIRTQAGWRLRHRTTTGWQQWLRRPAGAE